MPLSPVSLREALRPLFDPDAMPASVPSAVSAWARAYVSYARQATAGGTLPGPLAPVPAAGEFLEALDQTLRTMWLSVPWAAPGLVGTTAAVPPLRPRLVAHFDSLSRSFDRDLALTRITEAVHTYTLSITVSVVAPGAAPVIVPLA